MERLVSQIRRCGEQFDAISAQIENGDPSIVLLTHLNEQLEFFGARLDTLEKRMKRFRRQLLLQKLKRDAARFQAICGELERHGRVLLTMPNEGSVEITVLKKSKFADDYSYEEGGSI
jgi:hypothetical protein